MIEGRMRRVAGGRRRGGDETSVRRAAGTIDRLSLNAITVQADLGATLQALAGGVDVTLPDGTSFFWEDGHVWSENADAEPMTWCARSLTVPDLLLTQTQGVASAGRPVTDLILHPVLSDDIVMREVLSSGEPCPWTLVEVESPIFGFDFASGSVWPMRTERKVR